MATKEFYIRSASDVDARGPFNIDQLVSLAEAGQVQPDTLYYEATSEQWLPIGDDTELRALVFPGKKKLTIRRDPRIKVINKPKETDAPVDVHDMLAAAEGRTSDTRSRRFNQSMVEVCAKAGSLGCILILLLAVGAEVLPSIDNLVDFSWPKLLIHPELGLGICDLVLAVLIGLGVISAYPLVRARAMIGLGFMGFIYYVQGLQTHMGAAIAGCLGLYMCTVFLSYAPMLLAWVLGVGGMGGLAYMLIF